MTAKWNDLGLSYEAAAHGMQSAVAFETEWTLTKFKAAIDSAVAAIPSEYSGTATVELNGYDTAANLKIFYLGPESPEDVASRIRSCKVHVDRTRRSERETFERLRAKYGDTR